MYDLLRGTMILKRPDGKQQSKYDRATDLLDAS